jgi:hypothetical protein
MRHKDAISIPKSSHAASAPRTHPLVSTQLKSLISIAFTLLGGKRIIRSSTKVFHLVEKRGIAFSSMALRRSLVCFSFLSSSLLLLILSHPHVYPWVYEFNWSHTGIDFYRHAILNSTSWDYSTINGSTILLADAINPGGINAYDPDLRPFQKLGHKVIEYHGYQDPVIPSLASGTWYDKVQGFYGSLGGGKTGDIESFYRLFMVPGMEHCSGGDGGSYPLFPCHHFHNSFPH